MRKHRTQQEKLDLIAAFEQSEESKATFCKRNSLSITTLNNWLHKERMKSKGVTFVNVPQIPHPIEQEQQIKLHVGNITLSLPMNTEPTYLGEIVKVICYV